MRAGQGNAMVTGGPQSGTEDEPRVMSHYEAIDWSDLKQARAAHKREFARKFGQ
jgi:hypothetical protein